MAINVSQAFHRTSANPVDESMALTKAQMKTVNDNLMPAYYFTICQDDGEIYLYDKSATVSAETGKFKKFEGGGSGSSTEGVVITKTLLASGWDANNRQTLTFTGYESNMGGVVGMPTNATAAQKEAYAESGINVYSQDGNQFTFSCKEKPSVDLPVTLYAGGGSGSGGGGTADFPTGGTTGQALVKASDADNDVEWGDVGGEAFIITVTMDGSGNFSADKTPKELEDALAENTIAKVYFPIYGLVLDLNVNASGNFAFSGFYIENDSDPSTSAFVTILLAKDTDTTWSNINFQTIQGDRFSKEIRSNNGRLTQPTIYLNDVDHVEDEDNERDDIYPHRLTPAEMADIMSTLPGAPIQQHTYSTTERKVGTWVDGKDLYERVITGTTETTDSETGVSTTTVTFNGSIYGSVMIKGGYLLKSGNQFIPLNFPWGLSDKTATAVACFAQPGNIVIKASPYYAESPFWVVIQYTKPTV